MKKRQLAIALMLLAIVGAFAAFPSLLPRPASATEPVGSLDTAPSQPETANTDVPTEARMLTGAAARKRAQSRFDLIVQTIQSVDPTNVSYEGPYFSVPRFTGYPGLCTADAYSVASWDGHPHITVSKAFRLIGSTEAPGPYIGGPADAESQKYDAKAEANCAARSASRSWFIGDNDQDVWNALHLVDGIIAALRSYRPLTFSIRCKTDNQNICKEAKTSLADANVKNISVQVNRQLVDNNIMISTDVDLRNQRRQPMQIHILSPGLGSSNVIVVEFSPWTPPIT